jgi:nitrogen fixation/metabolism regulation signal transduction histidine kinase
MAETAQASAAPPQGRPKHQRHLRNYLLNAGLQLRFTLIIVAISATLTGGLGYVVMSKAHEASRVVQVRAMDPTDEMAQQLVAQFAHNDKVMLAVLIAFGVLLSVVLSAYGIVLTHKIAGPLYKVTLYLDKIRDGKLGQVYNLRKGDELVEFFEHFKAAHDTLRKATEGDIALLDKAIAQVGTGGLSDEMKALRDKKAESLK